MKRERIEYISNYLFNMICDENIVSIMKQNTRLDISESDFKQLNLPGGMNGFFCEYSELKMISAYEPFLNIIREMVERNNIDVDGLLESSNIYSLQRSVFKSYIEMGHIEREEDMLLGEIEFEKEKMIKGIADILLKISEISEIFVLINDANLMCDSTLSVIEYLVNCTSYRFKVLLITNEKGKNKSYIAERYAKFLEVFEEKGYVIDWPFEEKEANTEEVNFNINNSEEELLCIKDMFYSLAIEQAEYYMEIIYQKIELEKVYSSVEYRISMITLYIMISIFMKNYSHALVLCDKLNLIKTDEYSDRKDYQYYYYRALANMYIGNTDDASKDADVCIEYSKKFDDEYMRFNALMVKNMSELAGWKDIWICDREVIVPDELIDLCHKYNYMNHLAHVFVYCFHNDASDYKEPEGIEERIPQIIKGIDIAEKLGNDQFLIEAYRKNIMVSSYNGYFSTAGYFYSKSVVVTKRTNNKFEEANIYNGLGYICCTSDRYSEANRYYNKALEIFYEQKSSDYIIETVYNMGINAILAGDYSHAFEYLKSVNSILKILKKNSLRVCNISKIFGLTAIAAFKHGDYYSAKLYANKAENFLKYILDYDIEDFENYVWSEDVFLYLYVSALVEERMGNIDGALEYYARAKVHMFRNTGSMFFNYVHYAVDKSSLLKKIGRMEEANKLLNDAKKFYEEKGNFLRVRMFDELINTGRWEISPMNMSMTGISMDMIMEHIRLESIKQEVYSRRNQLRFFGSFQELINQEYPTVESEINALISNFRMNFNLDNILFINCEGDEPEIKYNDLEYDISKDDINSIVEFFKLNSNGFALSKYSNNYQEYDEFLKTFDKSKIFSVIGAPVFRFEKLKSIFIVIVKVSESWHSSIDRDVLDDEDFEMYMIIFRMILDAIEKFRLNEELKRRAVTDELTGLYNRNGYYEILDNMLETVKKTGNGIDVTMMYMDLDHFKYYNDTFGHQVGDALLREFAKIFTFACNGYGNVIRFGGDEFIILLNTKDKEIVREVSNSIYRIIEERKGFTDVVKQYKSDDFVIPEEYLLTVSIGIDIGINLNSLLDFGELQKHADRALYNGKNNGRGHAVIYKGHNNYVDFL